MSQQFRVKVRAVRFHGGGELRLLTKPVPAPVINEGAIAMVEALLERLRSGETTDVGMCEVHANGCSASGYSLLRSYSGLVVGAQTLAFRLMHEFRMPGT